MMRDKITTADEAIALIRDRRRRELLGLRRHRHARSADRGAGAALPRDRSPRDLGLSSPPRPATARTAG
jgi:hypothetical protein